MVFCIYLSERYHKDCSRWAKRKQQALDCRDTQLSCKIRVDRITQEIHRIVTTLTRFLRMWDYECLRYLVSHFLDDVWKVLVSIKGYISGII